MPSSLGLFFLRTFFFEDFFLCSDVCIDWDSIKNEEEETRVRTTSVYKGELIIRRKRVALDSKRVGRSRHTRGIFFGYRKSKTREVPSSEAVSTRVHSGESAKSNMALVWPRRSRTHWDVRASQSRTTPSVDVLRVRAKNRRKSTTWSARVIGRKNVNSIAHF